jgi:hypothetical protein
VLIVSPHANGKLVDRLIKVGLQRYGATSDTHEAIWAHGPFTPTRGGKWQNLTGNSTYDLAMPQNVVGGGAPMCDIIGHEFASVDQRTVDDSGCDPFVATEDFMVWQWVCFKGQHGQASGNTFARGRDGAGNGWSIVLRPSDPANSYRPLAGVVVTVGSIVGFTAVATEPLIAGTWNHLAMVVRQRSGVQATWIALYVNGREVAVTGLTGLTTLRSSTKKVTMGVPVGAAGGNNDLGRCAVAATGIISRPTDTDTDGTSFGRAQVLEIFNQTGDLFKRRTRRLWTVGAVAAGGPTFNAAWVRRQSYIIGGGI